MRFVPSGSPTIHIMEIVSKNFPNPKWIYSLQRRLQSFPCLITKMINEVGRSKRVVLVVEESSDTFSSAFPCMFERKKKKISIHLSFHQTYGNEHVLHVIYIFHESLVPLRSTHIFHHHTYTSWLQNE